ncbi:Ribosomal large subunit pseudouridine synthase B [hydrothermal vent metagenome]|uniref:Ribosomal large subunit pseudouridine synthase B n=1 Tax=hydrothermal vent metagenome TaxID=652676 RepID=A0A3B0TXV8_9ZZZZ
MKNTSMTGNRLAKIMARHGLCSRRQGEQWITDGRVTVNGKLIRTPAFNVIDSDKIEVDGSPIAERKGTRVWLYHKPAGLVVTESDPEGRPTVFEEFVRRGLPRVLSVGRLDINTEGLLMLTNDGGLKRTLELPATGWLRRYRVRAHGSITQDQLDKLKRGISVDGVKYGSIDAKLEKTQGANVWLIVALSEGKNREIKNVLASLGLQVNRLIRTSFGPFQLGDIPVGGIDTVKARVLQDQLGQKLAKKAGVDFEAPMPDALAPDTSIGKRKNTRSVAASQSRDKMSALEAGAAHKAKPRSMGFKGKGREQDQRKPFEKNIEEVELRKVHFSGGRAAEMFEPQAKSKRDERERGGPRGGGGTKGRGGPRGSGGPKEGGGPKGGSRPKGRGEHQGRGGSKPGGNFSGGKNHTPSNRPPRSR